MANDLERYLVEKAAAMGSPIKATLELSPLCNLNCAMCYIRHSQREVCEAGGLLSASWWESLIPELQEMGVLFVTLIGGEPFLYPDLERLYRKLAESGFYLNLTTNATLLANGVPDWMLQSPPRYISVSLYGADDKTYELVTGDPAGFTKTMAGLENLLGAGIPVRLNYVALPENIHSVDRIFAIRDKYDLPLIATGYCFPQARREQKNGYRRLTPHEAAKAELQILALRERDRGKERIAYLAADRFSQETSRHTDRIYCHAGSSTFWISWRGEMLPCGMMKKPVIPVQPGYLQDAWNEMKRRTGAVRTAPECAACSRREICLVCPAIQQAETGFFDQCPEYLCSMTEKMVRLAAERVTGDEGH